MKRLHASVLAALMTCGGLAGLGAEEYRFIVSGSTNSVPDSVKASEGVAFATGADPVAASPSALEARSCTWAASLGTAIDLLRQFGMLLMFK